MTEYHKINSIFKRDMTAPSHPFIMGEWAMPEFDYLQNNDWEWTEKVDGTNIRVMFDGKNITIGGKTDNASIPSPLVTRLQELFYKLPTRQLMKETFCKDGEDTSVCFYGEGFGVKIQNGGNYIPDGVDFYLFDVKVGRWWLAREAVAEIAEKFGLLAPVVVGHGTIQEAIEFVKNGFKSSFGTADAEGLVLRPTIELFSRNGDRIITKIKYRDFEKETT